MSEYLCERCGVDWTGAPGHPKSYCDEIFIRMDHAKLLLQNEELKKLITQALPFMRARQEWKPTAPHADMIRVLENAVADKRNEVIPPCAACGCDGHDPSFHTQR